MKSILRALTASFAAALVTFVVFFPVVALAQAAAAGTASPDIGELIKQLLGTVEAWKAGGWIAGMVAVVNLLTNVLKFAPLADWLEKLKIGWWLRPVISLVLGIAAAVFANLLGGVNAGTAVLIALLSGLSSTGFHELMTALFNDRVKAERAAGAKLVEIIKTVDATATTATAPLAADLARIASQPSPDLRVAALVEWAKANPPKAQG